LIVSLKQIAIELTENPYLPKKRAKATLGVLAALTTRHLRMVIRIFRPATAFSRVGGAALRWDLFQPTARLSKSPLARRSLPGALRN